MRQMQYTLQTNSKIAIAAIRNLAIFLKDWAILVSVSAIEAGYVIIVNWYSLLVQTKALFLIDFDSFSFACLGNF